MNANSGAKDRPVKIKFKKELTASAIFTLSPVDKNGAAWPFTCTEINGKPQNINAEEGVLLLFSKKQDLGPKQVCTLTINITGGTSGLWQFSQSGNNPIGMQFCPGSDQDVENSISTALCNNQQTLTVTLKYPRAHTPIGETISANFAFVASLTKDGTTTQYISKDPGVDEGDDGDD